MMVGGEVGGRAIGSLDVPYGTGIGVAVGALVVFGVFAALYTRYDTSFAQ